MSSSRFWGGETKRHTTLKHVNVEQSIKFVVDTRLEFLPWTGLDSKSVINKSNFLQQKSVEKNVSQDGPLAAFCLHCFSACAGESHDRRQYVFGVGSETVLIL